jgi:hypothetical protein
MKIPAAELFEEIEAYAAAKASGNALLMQRQGAAIKSAVLALYAPEHKETPGPASDE